jgi:hypothetical protein
MKQINLGAKTNAVNVDCTAFSSGTYYYSLIVDNKTMASNKMIVAK